MIFHKFWKSAKCFNWFSEEKVLKDWAILKVKIEDGHNSLVIWKQLNSTFYFRSTVLQTVYLSIFLKRQDANLIGFLKLLLTFHCVIVQKKLKSYMIWWTTYLNGRLKPFQKVQVNKTPNYSNHLTLSLLGYLKTRICWGGVNLTPPPSKSHVWCPNMTNDTSLESSCALLLESAKKIANLQKFNFLSQNPVIK